MAKLRQIALNNNAGAYVNILASIPLTRMELMEDEGAATQGLQVKSILDAFATNNVFSFGSEPCIISSVTQRVGGNTNAPILGWPAQSGLLNTAATQIASARSNGAAGTTVRCIEYE